jgi:hypothetical protein
MNLVPINLVPNNLVPINKNHHVNVNDFNFNPVPNHLKMYNHYLVHHHL